MYHCLFNRSQSYDHLLSNGLTGKQAISTFSQWLQALISVFGRGIAPLSKYNRAVGQIPASHIMVLMWESVSCFLLLLFNPLHVYTQLKFMFTFVVGGAVKTCHWASAKAKDGKECTHDVIVMLCIVARQKWFLLCLLGSTALIHNIFNWMGLCRNRGERMWLLHAAEAF